MKYHFILDDEPVVTGARKREAAAIPPFSISGPLDVSDSGFWFPNKRILLTGCTVTASVLPADNSVFASFQIIRIDTIANNRNHQETLLAAREMSPTAYQTNLNFKPETDRIPPIISPFEPVFVRSLRASGHENVVIQLVGVYV